MNGSADARFRTFKERLENRDLITELLDAELKKRTTAVWLESFAGRVPAAPVNDIAGALDNPFVQETGRIHTLDLPGHMTLSHGGATRPHKRAGPDARCPGTGRRY